MGVCLSEGKSEGKVVDKVALIKLGHKLTFYGACRSVNCWDEELCKLVKEHRACFTQGLDNDSS